MVKIILPDDTICIPGYPQEQRMIFRFDDYSTNTDHNKISEMVLFVMSKFPEAKIVLGVSTITHNNCGERIFPSILNAYSDYRKFYEVDKADSLEPGPSRSIIASHGLIHVDHRHLSRQTQEMSILVSCSLCKSKIFIPPFNKWNEDTESICEEHGIELIKYEDGWKSAEHNAFDPSHLLWYLHPYAWTVEKFKEWLG